MTGTLYLSQILAKPITDANDVVLGVVSDLAISTSEVFPRVVAVSFKTADKTPRILSWQEDVAGVDPEEGIRLSKPLDALEYDYLAEDELLLARDLLHKQIVDVQGKKVQSVSDLKLSNAGERGGLRLLGAECGLLGRLQFMPRFWAGLTRSIMDVLGQPVREHLIAWNYIDLPGRNMSNLELSVSHKRLHKLRPADVADIIEQLDPAARAAVFAHLDKSHAAETISEMEDEYQADVIEDLPEDHASDLLSKMDPDDAADIIADLDYDKAERLLRLMGFEDAEVIRSLLGYPKDTAGGIMTPEVAVATETMTVAETKEYLRTFANDASDLHYVYLVADADADGRPIPNSKLVGVVTLYELVTQDDDTLLSDFVHRDVLSVGADADQEDVAEMIAKYNLLALPVVDEHGNLLGTVTVDDAFDVMEEEAEEDLARATGRSETADMVDGEGDVLSRIGRMLRWVLPESMTWIGIWLGFSLILYIANSYVQTLIYNPELSESVQDYVITFSLAFSIVQLLIITLPLIFATIRFAVLRAIERLTDQEEDERPATGTLYVKGGVIALVHAVLVYLIAILFNIWTTTPTTSIVEFFSIFWKSFTLFLFPLFVPLVTALLLTALFAVWRVGSAVKADDADIDISPAKTATVVMLVFVLMVTVLAIPTGYAYYRIEKAKQDAAAEAQPEEEFDYMGTGEGGADYGDTGATGGEDMIIVDPETGEIIEAPVEQ